MTTEAPRLYHIDDARAQLGGIGLSTIYDLMNDGEITKVKIGRRTMITGASLDAYVERLAAASAAGEQVTDGPPCPPRRR